MMPLAIVRPILMGAALLIAVVLVIWLALKIFSGLAERRLTVDDES